MIEIEKLNNEILENIAHKLQIDIEAANAHYQKEIEPLVTTNLDIYNSSKELYRKMFPRLSQQCELTTTDFRDVVASVMPSLMKTFFSTSDVITIQGRDGTPEDDDRAQKMQDLIGYELERGRAYMKFHRWFQDALTCNAGILKVDWERTYKPTEKQVEIAAEQIEQFMAEAEASEEIEVLSAEQTPNGTIIITYQIDSVDKNQPRLMNLSASEFRFSPDATSLEDADFVAHRKIVSLDYLRQQCESGLYTKEAVAEIAEKAATPEYTTLENNLNPERDEEDNPIDSGRKKLELYECYTKVNITEDPDALLKDMIITICNGTILRIEENTYERNPFFILATNPDAHRIWPTSGFCDLVAPLQHCKTAILRQMIYNLAQSNDARMAIDITQLVDVNDVIENNRYIRMRGDIGKALQPIPTAPLQPWSFEMLQYLDNAKEDRTGITKYNQGNDANSLNKTATGISLISQMANARLEQIARTFAETGVSELFRFLIKMNQLFVSEQTVIRLSNGPMTVNPDDLSGDFDLSINSGMGTASREQMINNLQVVRGIIAELAQAGMAGPDQIYNAATKLFKEMGFKDANLFVKNPQQVLQEQQMAQEQAAQQQHESPKVSVTYDDLPWQAQMQLLQSMGFQVTPEMFSEQATQRVLATAADAHAKADATRNPQGVAGDAATAMYLNQL